MSSYYDSFGGTSIPDDDLEGEEFNRMYDEWMAGLEKQAQEDPENPERAIHDNEEDWWDEI